MGAVRFLSFRTFSITFFLFFYVLLSIAYPLVKTASESSSYDDDIEMFHSAGMRAKNETTSWMMKISFSRIETTYISIGR